tara:strand:+ start:3138 stop:3803 length:666 start_codon:yes stop_codon:yes gene_type:complete
MTESLESTIFTSLERAKEWLVSELSVYETYDEGHRYPWDNYLWRDEKFRRAHLDVVDARDTKRLYMMHLTVFPHTDDGSPVFGFDLIAGPKKVTGAFHDFSPIDKNHEMLLGFKERVTPMTWSKKRELPEWARNIFSEDMVSAGFITDVEELESVIGLVKANLRYYLSKVGERGDIDFTDAQNKYCFWQKQNPHTPKVMAALGYQDEEVNKFIQECLFPER